MSKKPVMIYGYELTTPKFKGESYDLVRFDFELVEYFFQKLMETPIKDRAFRDKKNRMINLTSFKQSDDAHLFEGTFITARFGKQQDILDVMEQVAAGTKPKNHGVKNDIQFLIDTRNGLLLVEKDSERVISKDIIKNFINYHRGKIEDYLVAFNEKFRPSKMYRRGFLRIASLPSKSFFDEIKEFSTIKDAYYFIDITEKMANNKGKNNEASNLMYLFNKAKEEGLDEVSRIKISFENVVPKKSVSGVETYFKKLFESQYYDGLGVYGKLPSGRQRTIELENIQRVFDIRVEFNENGIPSISDLIKGMSKIALQDNPLSYKEGVKQYKGVVVNEDNQGEGVV